MRKITLDLDALSVESFDTTRSATPKRGTVHGHSITAGRTCFCPQTQICLETYDMPTCVVTACNDVTCTCPAPTDYGETCNVGDSCGPTQCVNTCVRCDSFSDHYTCMGPNC